MINDEISNSFFVITKRTLIPDFVENDASNVCCSIPTFIKYLTAACSFLNFCLINPIQTQSTDSEIIFTLSSVSLTRRKRTVGTVRCVVVFRFAEKIATVLSHAACHKFNVQYHERRQCGCSRLGFHRRGN